MTPELEQAVLMTATLVVLTFGALLARLLD